jgi:hypothetical protein
MDALVAASQLIEQVKSANAVSHEVLLSRREADFTDKLQPPFFRKKCHAELGS